MTVVSNTSPINYLVLVGIIDVLHELFETVIVPEQVRLELSDPGAPESVRSWIANPPSWLHVKSIEATMDSGLAALNPGERDAIILAEELRATLIILDDKPARAVAAERGLRVIGTLGLVDAAAEAGLIDLVSTIDKLRQTTFRAAPILYKQLLNRRERRPGSNES